MRKHAGIRLAIMALACLTVVLLGTEVLAQQVHRGLRNRYYRPYYRISRPYYRAPSQPYYYYPPKHYPQAVLPYRGYYPQQTYPSYVGSGFGGPTHIGPTGATYRLSSPRASYYPNAESSGEPVVRANFSHLLFNVSPGNALIYFDDKLIGSARSFSSLRERYEVLEGEYTLRIEHPGYNTFENVLKVIPNRTIHLDIELQRIVP